MDEAGVETGDAPLALTPRQEPGSTTARAQRAERLSVGSKDAPSAKPQDEEKKRSNTLRPSTVFPSPGYPL